MLCDVTYGICTYLIAYILWHILYLWYGIQNLMNSLPISFLQGRPDVRMVYIQFSISFLLSGDNSTIGQLLETKGTGK